MFKTMDPELVRSLIEGQEDILTKAVQKEAELYKEATCPMCNEVGAEKCIVPPRVVPTPDGPRLVTSPFISGRLLPVGYAHCIHCNTDFDPRTGIIRKTEASLIAGPPLGSPPK